MKRTKKLLTSFCLAFLILNFRHSVFAAPYNYYNTEVTRWSDPYHTPMTYEEYLAQYPVQPFHYTEIDRFYGWTDDPLPFVVMVNETLYPQIESSIDTYCADLASDGFAYVLYTTQGGTPEDIKDLLIAEWELGAVGALLVGDLPVPWFELYEDFDNNGIPDYPWMVNFPCDLFYMDLDGDWYDTDNDGKYDVHEGSWQPDIWIGTLRASPLSGSESAFTNNYFAKNHAFRAGTLTLPDMALAYIDDDWSGGAPDWAAAIEQAWANTVLVSEINTTTADDYIDRWDDDYQHVLLASHSAPTLHTLKENNGASWGDVYSYQIPPGDPHFFFYNLFACSNCRYIENNNCGSTYIFTDTYGINTIGSTKTGSMLFFEDYYAPLSDGVTLGEAFRVWMSLHANETNSQMWARSWFYGMTNLGDPTISPRNGIRLSSFEIIDDGSGLTSGDGDGIPDNGETVELSLTLTNSSPSDYQDLYIIMSTDDEYTDIISGYGYISSIVSGDSVEIGGFTVHFDENTPDQHHTVLSLDIIVTGGPIWYEGLEMTIRAPKIELVSYDWREITGNGDGILDEGETIGLTFALKNSGGQECWKHDPGAMSEQNCITETSAQADYYFPIDSLITIEELATQFLFFPDGHAGIGIFYFTELLDDIVSEPFFLPGGESVNVYFNYQGINSWRAYPIDESYNCEWKLDSLQFVSSPVSFHYGFGEEYPPLSDGALELPLLNLLPNSALTFNHIYDIEEGYDGGIVEIRNDDEWSLIIPDIGYPGTSVSNGSFPGGPCYNDSLNDWTDARFDLSGYEGCVKIRFRFGSDGGVEGGGWNIDDFAVNSGSQKIEPESAKLTPGEFKLTGNYPNPFNSATAISFTIPRGGNVKLSIFNTLGQTVVILAEENLSPGEHKIHWQSGNSPTGIYFYQLEFAGQTLVNKCLLLK